MKNHTEFPTTSKIEDYVLGPRTKASVFDRLQETLFKYSCACPQLEKLNQQLQFEESNEEFSALSLTEIVHTVGQFTKVCPLSNTIHENLVRDIYMRAMHCRKWRSDVLYLSEDFVKSNIKSSYLLNLITIEER